MLKSFCLRRNLIAFTDHGSDPYVRLYLLPDKRRSGRRKTHTLKRNLNPVYDQTWAPSRWLVFSWCLLACKCSSSPPLSQVWVHGLTHGAPQEDSRCRREERWKSALQTQRPSGKGTVQFGVTAWVIISNGAQKSPHFYFLSRQVLVDLTHEDISKGFTQWLVFITRSRKLLTHFLHHFTVVTWKVVTQRRVGGRRKEERRKMGGREMAEEEWGRGERERWRQERETGEREERLAGRERQERKELNPSQFSQWTLLLDLEKWNLTTHTFPDSLHTFLTKISSLLTAMATTDCFCSYETVGVFWSEVNEGRTFLIFQVWSERRRPDEASLTPNRRPHVTIIVTLVGLQWGFFLFCFTFYICTKGKRKAAYGSVTGEPALSEAPGRGLVDIPQLPLSSSRFHI